MKEAFALSFTVQEEKIFTALSSDIIGQEVIWTSSFSLFLSLNAVHTIKRNRAQERPLGHARQIHLLNSNPNTLSIKRPNLILSALKRRLLLTIQNALLSLKSIKIGFLSTQVKYHLHLWADQSHCIWHWYKTKIRTEASKIPELRVNKFFFYVIGRR